jgi:hypothetical protein
MNNNSTINPFIYTFNPFVGKINPFVGKINPFIMKKTKPIVENNKDHPNDVTNNNMEKLIYYYYEDRPNILKQHNYNKISSNIEFKNIEDIIDFTDSIYYFNYSKLYYCKNKKNIHIENHAIKLNGDEKIYVYEENYNKDDNIIFIDTDKIHKNINFNEFYNSFKKIYESIIKYNEDNPRPDTNDVLPIQKRGYDDDDDDAGGNENKDDDDDAGGNEKKDDDDDAGGDGNEDADQDELVVIDLPQPQPLPPPPQLQSLPQVQEDEYQNEKYIMSYKHFHDDISNKNRFYFYI